MKTALLRGYTGLDLRNIDEAAPPTSWREAVNVDLTTGGGVKSRDELRLWHTVDASSVGLYTTGGKLRAAVPLRRGTAGPRPPLGMEYDFLGNTVDGYDPALTLQLVTSSGAWYGTSYLVVQHSSPSGIPQFEHHYLGLTATPYGGAATTAGASTTLTLDIALTPGQITGAPGATVWFSGGIGTPIGTYRIVSVTDSTHIVINTAVNLSLATFLSIHFPGDTHVETPFTPGPAMVIAASRVWAGSLSDNDVWYSTVKDPTNYIDPNDAGFLATATHIDGDQTISGLYIFKDNLAVLYRRNVQVWNVTQIDPLTFGMVDSVGGAGTTNPKSVANMMGDLVFFSEGGFRLLSAVITTGQAKDGDIGINIQELTANLPEGTPPLVSLWSPSRAQYLGVAGRTGFVFTYSPVAKIAGWTTYTFPWEVESMVELEGVVYLRRKDQPEIYVFDPAASGVESGYAWHVRFPFANLDEDTDHYLKQFKMVVVHQHGESTLEFLTDPDDLTSVDAAVDIDGSTTGTGKVPAMFLGEVVSIRVKGTGKCRLDEIKLRYDVGNIV